MSKRKNKKGAAVALIYVRYLLPVLLLALLIGALFVPCLQYSTVEGTQDEISTAELMENSWEQVRAYLFATSEREAMQERFSWTLLALIPVLIILYAVAAVVSVAVAIGAVAYLNSYEFRKTDTRIWFITVFPNRIVVCALQALMLPLLFYSRLMIPLYDAILHVDVLLNVSFPEPWVWGLIAYGIVVILSIISSRYERELDADPFKKIKPPAVRVIDGDGEEEKEQRYDEPKTEAERIYLENQRRAREEQAELIRKLLNKNEEEK